MNDVTNVLNVKALFDAMARERAAFLRREPYGAAWYKTIDGPPDMGTYHTGDDGWDALDALTEAAMAQGKIAARAEKGAVHRMLACVLWCASSSRKG